LRRAAARKKWFSCASINVMGTTAAPMAQSGKTTAAAKDPFVRDETNAAAINRAVVTKPATACSSGGEVTAGKRLGVLASATATGSHIFGIWSFSSGCTCGVLLTVCAKNVSE